MTTFLAAIFVFGLLIVSHEFGHFVVAKLSGVGVLEFSIGMGPKLISFKRGETLYSLRAFPIGGYVKMLGEDTESDDPRAFCNKNPFRRIPIIIAGAFMNFLLAIILFSIFYYNIGVTKPIVGKLEPKYPAEIAGVKVDDKLLKLDGTNIVAWDEFMSYIMENGNKEIKMELSRNGQIITINVKPMYNEQEKRYMVGISPKQVKVTIFESLNIGVKKTISTGNEILKFIGNAFKGKITSEDVGGPVAIIKMSGEVAKMGILNLILFAGLLSVNLGIINLIPFPALDGGWVIILLVEGITKKRISENKLGLINFVGFAILIGLMLLVTYKDIVKFF